MFLSQDDVDEVYLQVAPVDFRKGIWGLAAMIEGSMRAKPGKKLLFAFTDRSKRKVKIVYWDATGYAMWSKILESEKFRWPKRRDEHVVLNAATLGWLLNGINIDVVKLHEECVQKSMY